MQKRSIDKDIHHLQNQSSGSWDMAQKSGQNWSKIIQKWIFNHFSFKIKPVNKGYQKIIPLKIANTAPIDNT